MKAEENLATVNVKNDDNKGQLSEGSVVVSQIPIEDLTPDPEQPRQFKDGDDAQKGLVDNIFTSKTVYTPIHYRIGDDGKKYIVMGERRWRAAKTAGLTEIPAILYDSEVDYRIAAYMDNQDRKKLLPMEEAKYLKKLLDTLDLEQQELAERLNISASRLSEMLKIANLSYEIQQAALASPKWTAQKLLELAKMDEKERDFAFRRANNENTTDSVSPAYSKRQLKGWMKSIKTIRNKVMKDIDLSLPKASVDRHKSDLEKYFTEIEKIYNSIQEEIEKKDKEV